MEKVTVRLGKTSKKHTVAVVAPGTMKAAGLALHPQNLKGIKSTLQKGKDGNISVQVFLLNDKLLEKKSSNFDISPQSAMKAKEILRRFPLSVEEFMRLEDSFLSEVKRLLCNYRKTRKCVGSMQNMIDISIMLQTLFGKMPHHKKYFNIVVACKSLPNLKC